MNRRFWGEQDLYLFVTESIQGKCIFLILDPICFGELIYMDTCWTTKLLQRNSRNHVRIWKRFKDLTRSFKLRTQDGILFMRYLDARTASPPQKNFGTLEVNRIDLATSNKCLFFLFDTPSCCGVSTQLIIPCSRRYFPNWEEKYSFALSIRRIWMYYWIGFLPCCWNFEILFALQIFRSWEITM